MDFQEYPKWIPVGDGIIVWNKEEEEKYIPVEPKKRGRPKKVENGDNKL